MSLLGLHNVSVQFQNTEKTSLLAVNQCSFTLLSLTKTAIIGESGCGKSILVAAIMGLLPATASCSGEITWQNKKLSLKLLNHLRGRALCLLPQNPINSLNPLLSVGFQVRESLQRAQPDFKKTELSNNARELFAAVGLSPAKNFYNLYPHQLSGGMAQRVLLAAALASKPKLLLADEPTKGLDPDSCKHNILLLHKAFANNAILLITHDLSVAATCDEIIVMYAGIILESGPPNEILVKPLHPYTRQLLAAHPEKGFVPIPGCSPDIAAPINSCVFAQRCALLPNLSSIQQRNCLQQSPPLVTVNNNKQRKVRCLYV